MKLVIFTIITLFSMKAFSISESLNFKSQYKYKVEPFLKSSIPILFPSFDNKKIHAHYFRRGFKKLLLVIPGYCETAQKYQELLYDLKEMKYDFIVIDLRSQGRSDRLLDDKQKVHVNNYNDYLKDLDKLHQLFIKNESYQEIVILGHSLGGAIALAHAQENPALYNKLILSSPMMEIKTTASTFIAKNYTTVASALGFSSSYAPGIKRPMPEQRTFEKNNTTQSKTRFDIVKELQIKHKDLYVRGGTNNWIKQAYLFSDHVFINRHKVKDIPMLMFLAGKDTLSHSERQTLLCKETKDCDRVLFKDAKHNILNEKDIFRNHAISKIKYFLKNGNPIIPNVDLNQFKGK